MEVSKFVVKKNSLYLIYEFRKTQIPLNIWTRSRNSWRYI